MSSLSNCSCTYIDYNYLTSNYHDYNHDNYKYSDCIDFLELVGNYNYSTILVCFIVEYMVDYQTCFGYLAFSRPLVIF